MRIVDSPSYQDRRTLEGEKENTKFSHKKLKTETPKFDYLRRKSLSADDFLKNSQNTRRSLGGSRTSFSSSAASMKALGVISKQDDGSSKTPLRGPSRNVEKKIHPLCSRRKSLSQVLIYVCGSAFACASSGLL